MIDEVNIAQHVKNIAKWTFSENLDKYEHIWTHTVSNISKCAQMLNMLLKCVKNAFIWPQFKGVYHV